MNAGRTRFVHRIVGLALVAGAAVLGGCYYHARTGYVGGVEVVYDDSGYYDYSTYPQYSWNGRIVYLVGDRWYYRSPNGWAYFATEPYDLYGYRRHYYSNYGYVAPPAYGRPPPTHYYSAPPAYRPPPTYRSPPPTYQAPPTYRGPQVAPPAPRYPYPHR